MQNVCLQTYRNNTLKSRLRLKKNQTLRVNNLRIFSIRKAKFSGYFYMNTNISGDFQIYISVPSIQTLIGLFPESLRKDLKNAVIYFFATA